jgi:hypothetical protein
LKRSAAGRSDHALIRLTIVEISPGGGGLAVRGGRVAGGQQLRPAEQLLAQGTGQVIALVGATLLQDRNDQIDEVCSKTVRYLARAL